jgi:hypothetical protein
VGGYEAGTLVSVEPTLKYHPCFVKALTLVPYRDWGQCQVGSLTGAVASQTVTEAPNGSLSAVGNRASSVKADRELDCETYKSSRCESRA